MRRTIIAAAATTAVLAAGAAGLPASAAGSDRPDSFHAVKSAAASPNGVWVHETLSSARDRDWFRFTLAHDAAVLVTLGNLPGNYALAVFDAHGHRVAASDRPGNAFEEIYRHWAAGDYYVRVDARSGVDPRAAYVLKFRPLAAGVVVAEHRNVHDVDGFDIKGELLNNTADWQRVLRIHVVWLDKSGHQTGSHDEGVVNSALAPRHRVEFDVVAVKGSADLPPGTTAYRLQVHAQATTDRPPAGLALRRGEIRTRGHQRLYRGTVTNRSSQTIRDIYPTVIEYDARGRARAFGYDHINSLAPGASHAYEAVVNINGLPTPNAIREYASIVG